MRSKHTPDATNKHNPNDQDLGKESKKPPWLCPTLPQAQYNQTGQQAPTPHKLSYAQHKGSANSQEKT